VLRQCCCCWRLDVQLPLRSEVLHDDATRDELGYLRSNVWCSTQRP
jgi:hypothetical protein